jgi:hypothetical protein
VLLLLVALFADQSPGSPGDGPVSSYDQALKARVEVALPLPIYGARDETAVLLQTRRHRSSLVRCYARGLNQRPNLAGSLQVEFIIQPTGKVSGVRLLNVEPSVEDEDLRQCLGVVYARIRFEETEGPVAAFTQELVFSRR